MARTLDLAGDHLGALISRVSSVGDERESTSEIASGESHHGTPADNDAMLEQRDDALGETRVIRFDVRRAEAVAAAILVHAKLIREHA